MSDRQQRIEEQIEWLVLEAETPQYRSAAERQKYSDCAMSMQLLLLTLERIANFFPDDVALMISGEAADMKDIAREVLYDE